MHIPGDLALHLQTMVGMTWTIAGLDREWILEKHPAYNQLIPRELKPDGTKRKMTPEESKKKKLFFEGFYNEYRAKFPGVMETWDLGRLHLGGTELERRKFILKVSETSV